MEKRYSDSIFKTWFSLRKQHELKLQRKVTLKIHAFIEGLMKCLVLFEILHVADFFYR